ncbi:MAG: efflux RND transporter permease subunit [Planctomycetes bacterium]|nr:efflux RND transporter permease subunit [Planctomycetota bacterium]
MLDAIIAFSLRNRLAVLAAALAVAVAGAVALERMPVDVFPDLDRPTVTVMTEAPGLAPEEVETLVTRHLEYLLNGATGVRRVRSSSGIGLSIVWVEFEWGTDIFRDRQIVAEKLQLARGRLPADATPVMAPVSSIMGEIMLLGLRDTRPIDGPDAARDSALAMRTLAEFTIRNRLLAIDGVAQVTVMGGILKQYQIITSPTRLAAQDVTLRQLVDAAAKANAIAGGGVMEDGTRESLIRISGQSFTLDEVGDTPVAWRAPRPVLVRDVADVVFGGPVKRGDGAVQLKEDGGTTGGPAVIIAIQKQPAAATLALDRRVDAVLDGIQADLPPGVTIERRIFRQADFIRAAIDNVVEAVRDGALWVVVVLFLFMWNLRVSVAALTAMPLSILATVLVFRGCGITLNTMTLGGIAVAIGDLVDDSIVDIENIYRRLRENRHAARPEHPLRVVFRASAEVRNSIVYATLIVTLVVVPLLSLTGLEGRMFAPLGLAYVIALLCSLAVSLTVTPVLGYLLLGRSRLLDEADDPWFLRLLKRLDAAVLRFTLRHARGVLVVVAILVVASVASIGWMGGEFLPPFNEGTLTIGVQTEPGTSLAESSRIARLVEAQVLEVPEVIALSRRTGRAELDEHAEGVHSSEIDVRLAPHERPIAGLGAAVLRLVPVLHLWGTERVGRPRDEVVADIRDRITTIPAVRLAIGQPISHRLDHILSGVRAQVVVKVFGSDLRELRAAAADIEARMAPIPGVVDLQVEPQVEIPQVRLRVDHREAARHGLAPGDVAELLETAYKGRLVSQVVEGDRSFGLVVWYDEESRASPAIINETILETPSGRRVALGQVAEVLDTTGPNTINREHVQRRIVVSCNVAGRDLAGVVADIRAAIAPVEERLRGLPGDAGVVLGGQFEARRDATRRLLILGTAAVVGVFMLLCKALGSWPAALQVLVNVPLAALGSVVALLIVNQPSAEALAAVPWWQWPRVWAGATTLSVAHSVGFITLIGIVSRNGIMMISHYLHLMRYEGEPFGERMVIRGSVERLAPVLMTAFTSFFGLLPLLFGAGQPGKEILEPLAVVVFGGMVGSTILDQIVTPALFFACGGRGLAVGEAGALTTAGATPFLDGSDRQAADGGPVAGESDS